MRAFGLFRSSKLTETIADVLFDGKMREKRERLKNVGKFAALRRNGEIPGGIEIKFFAQADFAGVRVLKTGDAIEKSGFSRSGRSEKNSKAWLERGGNI